MRPERLIPLLLGFALFVPLTWCFVRVDPGDASARESAASARKLRPGLSAKTAASEREAVGHRTPGLFPHELSMPVAGVAPGALLNTFTQARGGTRSHGALDIPAPRGTPVLATADGVVRKLFTSVRGGLTVYQFDLEERYCFYYAHLDGYAPSLHEGQLLLRGDLIGAVGATGNARKDAPHLHFAVIRLDPDKRWWGGTPVDPYPLLVR